MRKWAYILMIFGIASHGNLNCFKKVHVRKSFDLHSRTRVREGSPKKKQSNTNMKICKKILQVSYSKKWCKKEQKIIKRGAQKGAPKHPKIYKKSIRTKCLKTVVQTTPNQETLRSSKII